MKRSEEFVKFRVPRFVFLKSLEGLKSLKVSRSAFHVPCFVFRVPEELEGLKGLESLGFRVCFAIFSRLSRCP